MVELVTLSPTVAVICFNAQPSVEEVQRLSAAVRQHVLSAPSPCIYAVDLRPVQMFSQAVADALVGLMRSDNPKIRRNAVLFAPGAVFKMQLERMVRETGASSRRPFDQLNQAIAWLAQIATTEEAEGIRGVLESKAS